MSDTSEAVRLFENSPGWWDEAAWERVKAENARLRGDLDTTLGLRKMESRRADSLREQAEVLVRHLEEVMHYLTTTHPVNGDRICKYCGVVGDPDWRLPMPHRETLLCAKWDAALRAYGGGR